MPTAMLEMQQCEHKCLKYVPSQTLTWMYKYAKQSRYHHELMVHVTGNKSLMALCLVGQPTHVQL